MQNATKSISQIYIDQVSREVRDTSEFHKSLIEDLRISVEDYLSDNPNASLSELYDRYGDPHEIANMALQQTDPQKLLHKLKRQRIAKLIVVAIVGAFLAFALFGLGRLAINRYISQPYIIVSSGVNDGNIPLPTPMP